MTGTKKRLLAFCTTSTSKHPEILLDCPLHLVHLAAEKGASVLPVSPNDILVDIYSYFSKSSLRAHRLAEFQEKSLTFERVLSDWVRVVTNAVWQRLCRADDSHIAGLGAYVRGGFIYSSLAGWFEESQEEGSITIVKVKNNSSSTVIPSIDAIVTARVTNVNPRFCKCAIISVGTTHLRDAFRGIIRREDVRATEKDKVEMFKCFRPGDIIIARVMSLGDSQSYVLSTAENELGVAIATSEAGETMIPVSWCKMQCPKTLQEEYRKVAKVQPEYIEFVQS